MSISRRKFIQGSLLTGLATTLSAKNVLAQETIFKPLNTPKNPRNILIITADQLAKKAITGYGNDFVRTPGIDSLLKNGTKFEKTYCAFPLCAPSRACFWTGRLPHQTGIIANNSSNVPTSMETIGNLFSKAGYECAHFGKQHDYGTLDGFVRAPQKQKEVSSSDAFPVNYDTKEDAYCLQESLKFLKKQTGEKPFLMAIEFNNPHNICGWVGEFADKHDDIPGIGTLPPLPTNFTNDDLMSRSKSVQYACCTHQRQCQSSQWSDLNFRQYLKAYYHYIELTDKAITEVLATLKMQGLEDETLVVFFADHGDSMGAHKLVTKMNWFYDETTNVPLVFCASDLPKDKTLTQLSSLCDLLPTLCEYVGIEAPKHIYGQSLLPLIKGEQVENWRTEVVSQWHTDRETAIQPARMMRTERYKYIIYRENEDEELYDMQEDPGEQHNLSKNTLYAQVLDQLRQQFKKYTVNHIDPFFTQESIINQKWRSHEVGYHHHQGDSSIAYYLKNIRPLEKKDDLKALEKAKKQMLKNSRNSYYKCKT